MEVPGEMSRAAALKAAFSWIVGTGPSSSVRDWVSLALCLATTAGEYTDLDLEPSPPPTPRPAEEETPEASPGPSNMEK